MSKEQKSNREKKKPKQDKTAKATGSGSAYAQAFKSKKAPCTGASSSWGAPGPRYCEHETAAIVPPFSFAADTGALPPHSLRRRFETNAVSVLRYGILRIDAQSGWRLLRQTEGFP